MDINFETIEETENLVQMTEAPEPKRCRWNAYTGLMNWFKLLRSLNEDKLLEFNGIDYTLYLVFLRLLSFFFLAITLYNAIVMVPIYLSGENETTNMNKITVDHVSGNKQIFSYFAALTIVTAGLAVTL